MGADFEDIFAGIRMRSAEESNHDLVDFFAATIEPSSNDGFSMIEFSRSGMRFKESTANDKHLRSRHSENSKSAVPQRCRDRNDRILDGNDLVQAFLHLSGSLLFLGTGLRSQFGFGLWRPVLINENLLSETDD